MILICYDGSTDAQAAIDRAGDLMRGQPATVLTVWEPFIAMMTRTGAGLGLWGQIVQMDEIDAASEQAARERADEGVERARRAGMNPQPRTAARGATIAETILSVADAVEASVIVLGTRGLTGLKSLWLGSVSRAVLQHADRPVIVVPAPEIAAGRAAHMRREA
jgi:nucleotide-binding universal stress UspA family protein